MKLAVQWETSWAALFRKLAAAVTSVVARTCLLGAKVRLWGVKTLWKRSSRVVLWRLNLLSPNQRTDALLQVRPDGWSGLRLVLRYQSEPVVLTCLTLLPRHELIDALLRVDSSGWSALELALRYQSGLVVRRCVALLPPPKVAIELKRVYEKEKARRRYFDGSKRRGKQGNNPPPDEITALR